jgi:hypothetical protein
MLAAKGNDLTLSGPDSVPESGNEADEADFSFPTFLQRGGLSKYGTF